MMMMMMMMIMMMMMTTEYKITKSKRDVPHVYSNRKEMDSSASGHHHLLPSNAMR